MNEDLGLTSAFLLFFFFFDVRIGCSVMMTITYLAKIHYNYQWINLQFYQQFSEWYLDFTLPFFFFFFFLSLIFGGLS